uniref:Uncharacterized protein n=1 Tax=Anguilla anguilla TaxID=7936 RepID=A0A0E9TNE1_ANGAN
MSPPWGGLLPPQGNKNVHRLRTTGPCVSSVLAWRLSCVRILMYGMFQA